MDDPSPRGRAWAETNGVPLGAIRLTRPEPAVSYGPLVERAREERESIEDQALAPGATRARGAGDRLAPEAPDPWRTCFERDRDRIVAAHCFRRLSGKTQVFIAPVNDHIRTRMTHALEVARVAVGIAAALRLNVAPADSNCGFVLHRWSARTG
jgi:dGTPase